MVIKAKTSEVFLRKYEEKPFNISIYKKATWKTFLAGDHPPPRPHPPFNSGVTNYPKIKNLINYILI